MAVKAVYDIEVNDGDFKKFAADFEAFKQSLLDSKTVWKQTGEEASKAVDSVTESTVDANEEAEKLEESSAKTSVNFHQSFTAIMNTSNAMTKVASSADKANKAANQQSHFWRDIARSSKAFASNMLDATKSFLSWVSVAGVVSGLLGGGGLFGISRLSQSASAQGKAASGIGVSPGERNAFETNFARLLDNPDAVLGGINHARLNPEGRAALYGAGLTENEIQNGNSVQLAEKAILNIHKQIKNTPDNLLGAQFQAFGWDKLGLTEDDILRNKNTPDDRIEEYAKNRARDTNSMDIDKPTQRAWDDLTTQLDRAGKQIESIFIKGLAPLAEPIKHLSESIEKVISDLLKYPDLGKWIESLGKGIESFASYLKSDEFSQDMKDFKEKIVNFAVEVGNLVGYVDDLVGGVKGIKEALDSIKTGALTEWATDMRDLNEIIKTVAGSFKLIEDYLPDWLKPKEGQSSVEDNAKHPFAGVMGKDGDSGPKSEGLGLGKWIRNYLGIEGNSGVRGIRNNNPLNLSYIPGGGAVPEPGSGRFGAYPTMEAGIAAEHQQLLRYQAGGIDTLSSIINKWAPSSDNNDTKSYIAQVSKGTGFDPNQHLDMHNKAVADAVIREMSKRESGAIDPAVIDRGVSQSLGSTAGPRATGQQVSINITNNTGANVAVTSNQLAA